MGGGLTLRGSSRRASRAQGSAGRSIRLVEETPLPARRASGGEGAESRATSGMGLRLDDIGVEPPDELRPLVAEVGGLPIPHTVGRDRARARELPELRPPDLQKLPSLAAGQDLVMRDVGFHYRSCVSLFAHSWTFLPMLSFSGVRAVRARVRSFPGRSEPERALHESDGS